MKSIYHGSESVSFLGPNTWDVLPDNSKDIENLILFEIRLKNRSLKITLVDSVKFTLIIYILFEDKRDTWNSQ